MVRGNLPKKYRVWTMVPAEVLQALPQGFNEYGTHYERELLKRVDVPQENKVLRVRQVHGQNFFHIETLKTPS